MGAEPSKKCFQEAPASSHTFAQIRVLWTRRPEVISSQNGQHLPAKLAKHCCSVLPPTLKAQNERVTAEQDCAEVSFLTKGHCFEGLATGAHQARGNAVAFLALDMSFSNCSRFGWQDRRRTGTGDIACCRQAL